MGNVSSKEVEDLLRWGMVAIPTPPGEKNPQRAGWQNIEYSDVQLAAWASGDRGVFVSTGARSGWVVLDLDNAEAAELWKRRLGEELIDAAPKSKTRKGTHLWFRTAGPWKSFTWQKDEEAKSLGAHYDLQADGKGVMAPPSLHPDGGRYRWIKKPYEGSPAVVPALGLGMVSTSREASGRPGDSQRRAGGGGSTRSLLSKLLDNPPEEGGRNEWLTQVLGHVAKEARFEDAFMAMARAINRSLSQPLDAAEVAKTAESIWRTEQGNHGLEPKQRTGWLSTNGNHLVALAKPDKDEDGVVSVITTDFDLQVLGKYADEENRLYYRLALRSELTDTIRYQVEAAATFATGRTMDPWLIGRELNWWPVKGDVGAQQGRPSRMAQYLSSQEAPYLQTSPSMGWHAEAEGFVCQEGLITPGGLNPQGGWLPDPAIVRRDKHTNRYGFEHTWEEARRVLREVLTFQDDTVTSVFGAWWAACLIKAQLMPHIAGFPFMGIEAMSGSGKTEGFFNLMVRLNGSVRDKNHYTPATFRDVLASNRSGIVWVDDPSDPTQYYEMIRTATNESAWSKKAQDNTSTASVNLVAPVLLTAESLPGMDHERALQDRRINLDVPSARDRESRHGRGSQWDDILHLRHEHPEMWRLSGWYVAKALELAPNVMSDWASLRSGAGRHADKMAVLRAGARVLAEMTDSPWHAEIVDEWVGGAKEPEGDYLVNRILPDYLRLQGWPTSPRNGQAAFVDEETGTVWFWPIGVSDWWMTEQRHADPRTRSFGTPEVVTRHRVAAGATTRKTFDRSADDPKSRGKREMKQYYQLPEGVSTAVLDRSRGV